MEKKIFIYIILKRKRAQENLHRPLTMHARACLATIFLSSSLPLLLFFQFVLVLFCFGVPFLRLFASFSLASLCCSGFLFSLSLSLTSSYSFSYSTSSSSSSSSSSSATSCSGPGPIKFQFDGSDVASPLFDAGRETCPSPPIHKNKERGSRSSSYRVFLPSCVQTETGQQQQQRRRRRRRRQPLISRK